MSYTAYITAVFPSLSETFIYREVEGLRRRGMRIRTFSVHRPDLLSIHPETAGLVPTTTYLRPASFKDVAAALARAFLLRPAACLGTLGYLMGGRYCRSFRDRLRTLFHFVEGALFARILRTQPGTLHIHAHYASHPATIALVASRLTGIPYSFTAHADDIVLDGLLLPQKVSAARFVVTCSGYGRDMLLRSVGAGQGQKVSMVHHGIDVHRFEGERPERNGPFTFLHVGRLSPEKAQHLIVQACSLLCDEGLDFVCLIVGDGSLRGGLARTIRDMKVEGRVRLVGRVFPADIPSYYMRADAFVLSSTRENLPNVLLESLAAGVPVIAPRLGGIEELVKHGVNGFLVQPGDASALSAAMRKMMVCGRERELMGQSGKSLVRRHFDRERCTDALWAVYEAHGIVPQEKAVEPRCAPC